MKESDIYYRYRGRTQRIKYPELRTIIEGRIKTEQELLLKHLTKIARIGVQDTGIFDLQTGSVTGDKGVFMIEESLLSQLSFIKEGEFSEASGMATLKLIGDLIPVGEGLPAIGKIKVVKSKGIRIGDIMLSFLDQRSVPDPIEYVKQICFESTGFLPVYYYLKLSKVKKQNAIKTLENVISRGIAKEKLLERIRDATTQELPLPSTGHTSQKKRALVDQLKNEETIVDLSGRDQIYCLQVIRSLSPRDVKRLSPYLRSLLKTWFNRHYASGDSGLVNYLRRAICWIDEALFMKDVK